MRVRGDERGFVLVTAMLVLGVFMALSLAMVTVVDVQADQTGHERSGEAAFNLATSALQAEAHRLQLDWPASAPGELPCSSTNAPATPPDSSVPPECMDLRNTLEGNLQSAMAAPDYSGAWWQVKVFDDDATDASDYADAPKATTYDANADNSMWVWATATTPNGQTRTVVEQVERPLETIPLPENALTAGGLEIKSNGTPPNIDAEDQGVTGEVGLRCDQTATPSDCVNQANPSSAYQHRYADPSGGSSALTSAQIQSLIQQAKAAGTLYDITSQDTAAKSGCPPDGGTFPNPPGASHPVVVVEGAGTCPQTSSYSSSWFPTTPGTLVFLQGSVAFGGNAKFNGLLYMANQGGETPSPGEACTSAELDSAPPLVSLSGSALIDGAVFVDGCGLVYMQNEGGNATNNTTNKPNIVFSLDALETLQSYGATTAVPGTFRVVTQ